MATITATCSGITYCANSEITSPFFDIKIEGSCCDDPIDIRYFSESECDCTIDNDPDLVFSNFQTITAEPCDTYSWTERLNFSLTDVASIAGTITITQGLTTISTTTFDQTYCNTNHTITAPRSYQYNYYMLVTLASGCVKEFSFYYTNSNNNHYSCAGVIKGLPFDLSVVDMKVISECTSDNIYTLDGEGCAVFPYTFDSGIYTISFPTLKLSASFFLDCNDFECKVINLINETLNSVTCYQCNTKEMIEDAFWIKLMYEQLIDDCVEGCDKKRLFEVLNNAVTTKCIRC